MEPSQSSAVQSEAKALAPTLESVVLNPTGLRAGWKSTEFWITLLLLALYAAGAVEGFIPPEHAALFALVTSGLYKILRFALKLQQGSDPYAALSALESVAMPRALPLAAPAPPKPNAFVQVKTLAALVLVTLFALLGLAFLSGCSSVAPATKAKWAATGSWLLGKAEHIALQTVLSAATSQADASNKADWMDSLATGLRTQATASFSSDDFEKLVGIWTPDKPHWEALAAQLAGLFNSRADLSPQTKNELIAQALQRVAAEARTSPAQTQAAIPLRATLPTLRYLDRVIVPIAPLAPRIVLNTEAAR